MKRLANFQELTEFFTKEVSSLLADQQGRRIGVRAEVVLPAVQYFNACKSKDIKRTGQILKSIHFKFWVPGV